MIHQGPVNRLACIVFPDTALCACKDGTAGRLQRDEAGNSIVKLDK
jgi:hypothetical protein